MTENQKWLYLYSKINNSFDKKLVYRVGVEAGFFSEYNNMLIAILFSLSNKISFTLSSYQNNFSFRKGWRDYFLPFCQEDNSFFHVKNNIRRRSLLSYNYKQRIHRKLYKLLFGVDYFTQDVWENIRSNYLFNLKFFIPELKIDGDIYQALKVINSNIWHFQPSVYSLIESQREKMRLPVEYIGLHIRSGDKSTEHKLFPVEKYIEKAASLTDCKSLFVATDDYSNIQELKIRFPEYKVYSLCSEEMHGFNEYAFNQKAADYRRAATLALLVDVEILAKANIFIGTYSSNVGMFMGLRRDLDTCYGLDFEHWRVW